MGVLSNNKDVTAVQARCLGAVSEFSVLRRGGREGETVVRPIILLSRLIKIKQWSCVLIVKLRVD